MKKLIFYLMIASVFACNQTSEKNKKNSKDNVSTIVQKKESPSIPPLTLATDSGKAYFKVAIYKNMQPFKNYEGDFAIASFSNDYLTLQMPASKHMLKISDFLVLYFRGTSVGEFDIVPSGSEKGKPTLIFTPELNGSYGVGVGATEGKVTITNYSDNKLSGNIEATGKDLDNNQFTIQAIFRNIKNNDLEKE